MRKTQNADRYASILADYKRGIMVADLMEHYDLTRAGIYSCIRKAQSTEREQPKGGEKVIIFLHPEQLLAMIEEELGQLDMEGEDLVFRSLQQMSQKLSTVMENAITNSRPTVVK